MRLVIDTNEIISALIRDNLTRKIILNSSFSFYSPDFVKVEIFNHKKLILRKSGLSEIEFNEVLNMLFENIQVVPIDKYHSFLEKARLEIDDVDDVPFVALAMSENFDGVWTNDKHFNKVKVIKIYSTKDLILLL
ncbi:MAG: PIN domain-containing protein [Candidatus Nanoarchaeia archaeon]|nr:PIN domain-containing protein [Candidatus Nanoarchaeia archaeon]